MNAEKLDTGQIVKQLPRYFEPLARLIDFRSFGEIDDLPALVSAVDKQELVNALVEASDGLPIARQGSLGYDFVADANLSGLGTSCGAAECRLERVSELAGFAALYSDQIVVRNPLQFAVFQYDFDETVLNHNEVVETAIAIATLLLLAPLIEKGIVTFSDVEHTSICHKCLSKLLLGSELLKSTDIGADDELYLNLYKDLLNNSTTTLDGIYDHGRFALKIMGNTNIFEHESSFIHGTGFSDIISKYSCGSSLEHADLIEIGTHHRYADLLFSDVVARNNASEKYRIRRHLAAESEIRLMKSIVGESEFMKGFSPSFPFISSSNIDQILSIREAEWHHFESFRANVHGCAAALSNGDATVEDVMRGTIMPAMVDIEKVIARSRRKAGRDLVEHSGVAALSIISTVATSGFSAIMASAVGLLGGGHFATKMIPTLQDRFSYPDEVLENDYYFAYRVKKILN